VIDAANRAVGAAGRAANEADRAASAASRAESAEADVDATNIQTYVARAESAADNASVYADVYPDVAAGRAAVARGEQLQVLAANGYEYIRYRGDSPGVSPEVGRFIGSRAPEYGFISGTSPSSGSVNKYPPLALDTSTRTITIRGRVVTGTRT